jgi:broad specificity phosphatase PhoE
MSVVSAGAITHLYLVRHGATEANERVPFILQGRGIDLPLSARGTAQAAALATFFAGDRDRIQQVYSSGMVRARQTAAAIAASLGQSAATLDDLQECDVGRWEGMDWESIRREFPDAHRCFADDPDRNPYLEGESYGDVLRRAWPVIDQLLTRHAGERIVVVAHNVVNRVLIAKLLGLEIRRAQGLHQGNGCVNLIRRRAGRTELVTYNSLFHLPSDLR